MTNDILANNRAVLNKWFSNGLVGLQRQVDAENDLWIDVVNTEDVAELIRTCVLRIKPEFVIVGDIAVLSPLRVEPANGTTVFAPDLYSVDLFRSVDYQSTWPICKAAFENGMLFDTAENARNFSKAVIQITM